MCWFISSKNSRLLAQKEQEHQEALTLLKNELAAKDDKIATYRGLIAELEKKVTKCESQEKSFASRWQQLIVREHTVEEKERNLEQREPSLPSDKEEITDYSADEEIGKIRKRFNYEWGIIKREKRTLDANKKRYAKKSEELKKCEQEMLVRAKLIADHLGVPLKCILNPREKKLVGKITNELPEERYALIDLVMSCPDDQVKALLAAMQRFPQSSQR